MKLMFASDLHGSAYWCEKLLSCYNIEQPDKLVLLGDILYHGPRNDLPEGYAPKKVITMLNEISDNILAVRGNCEAEVDQMVLDFPCMSDNTVIYDSNIVIFASHGHIYGPATPPKMKQKYVLMCGHTHVACVKEEAMFTYMNPGSISIPKENTKQGYIIYEDGKFTYKDLNSEIYDEVIIGN